MLQCKFGSGFTKTSLFQVLAAPQRIDLLRRGTAIKRFLRSHVDTAYMSSYVDTANLNSGTPAVDRLEAKMVLFGLVFLTMAIIATLYFT